MVQNKITYRQARLKLTKLLKRMQLSKKDIILFYRNCKKSKPTKEHKSPILAVEAIQKLYPRGFPDAWVFGYLVLSTKLTFSWVDTEEGFSYWQCLIGLNRIEENLYITYEDIERVRDCAPAEHMAKLVRKIL